MAFEVRQPDQSYASDSLADVLERVLDKGLVIAGDISISVVDVELLTIKIRLLLASADKAQEMGIDWWKHDPFLSSRAERQDTLELRERIASLEEALSRGARARDGNENG